jgi:hypothetical protein
MHTRAFVIISISVPPARIWSTALATLATHEAGGSGQTLEARFDRLSGVQGALHDPEAEGLLPAREKRVLRNRISFVRNLPPEEVPAALVLPSGTWHDSSDFGWTMNGEESAKARAWSAWAAFYLRTLASCPHDYVVETWVHS